MNNIRRYAEEMAKKTFNNITNNNVTRNYITQEEEYLRDELKTVYKIAESEYYKYKYNKLIELLIDYLTKDRLKNIFRDINKFQFKK